MKNEETLGKWMNNSGLFSLMVQIIIFIMCLYTVSIPLPEKDQILNKILLVENGVQLIEILFYSWLLFSTFKPTGEITWVRYLDWVFTTPAMLLSLSCFMYYINHRDTETVDLPTIWNKESTSIITIVVANLAMLFFGFLAEVQKGNFYVNIALGFVGFFISFYTIFMNFVGTNTLNQILFYVTFLLWMLYGVAALMPYLTKNIFYNILDIFSKNITALGLIFYIYYVVRG